MCYPQRQIITLKTDPDRFGPDEQSAMEAHFETCLDCGKAAQEADAVLGAVIRQKHTNYHLSRF